jgi:hypothetical protein
LKRSPALFALALLLPLGGCPLLQIEAELPEVCIARTGVTVPGALGQLETKVKVQLDELEGFDELEAGDELHFISFAAHPQSGGQELAGIRSAKVTLLTGDAGLPPVQIFSCEGDCVAADGTLSLDAASEANIAAYLTAPGAAVEVELHGSLPLLDFKVDLNACLSGEVTRSL